MTGPDRDAADRAEFDRLAAAVAEALVAAGVTVSLAPARLETTRDWGFSDLGTSAVAKVRVTAAPDPTGPGWRVVESREIWVMHGSASRDDEAWHRATAAEAIGLLRERLAIDPLAPG